MTPLALMSTLRPPPKAPAEWLDLEDGVAEEHGVLADLGRPEKVTRQLVCHKNGLLKKQSRNSGSEGGEFGSRVPVLLLRTM